MLFFLLVILVIIGVFWQGYRGLQTADLTPQERGVLTRQLVALGPPSVLFLAGMLFSTEAQAVYYPIGACLFSAGVGYTGISIIKNGLSVVAFRGKQAPMRGNWAATMGVILMLAAGMALLSISFYVR